MKINRYVIPLLAINLWCAPLASFSKDMSWVRTLRQILPPFKIEQIHPDGTGLVLRNPSPHGKWLVQSHERYSKWVVENAGVSPRCLYLYNKDGKLIRDLTYGKFQNANLASWSQSDDSLFINGSESNMGKDGVWKLDLKSNTFFRMNSLLPWLPSGHVETVTDGGASRGGIGYASFPYFSPNSDSYLLVDETFKKIKTDGGVKVRNLLYRVWMKSGKRKLLAEGDSPKWSPNGYWILFNYALNRRTRPSFMRDQGDGEIWIVRSNGAQKRCLIGEKALARAIEQSPARSYPSKKVEQIMKSIPGYGGVTQWGLSKHRWMYAYVTGYWWIASKQPEVIVAAHGEYEWGDGSNWIWLMNVNGRILKKAPLPGTVQLISGSADGKHFYFSSVLKSPDGNIAKESYYRVTMRMSQR